MTNRPWPSDAIVTSPNTSPTESAAPAQGSGAWRTSDPLLEVKNLKTEFFTDDGVITAVNDVSFSIPRGRTLGLVGESGSGKSVTALSLIRLISRPGRITQGQILFHDDATSNRPSAASRNNRVTDLTTLSEEQLRHLRGNRIGMIFQEPMTSLNPVFSIGNQITEAVRLHRPVSRREARDLAAEMLERVSIPNPLSRMKDYPHQFSGGMRQRVMIAMALVCRPQLLIADEPTTALDVTIQAQILDLLRELQDEFGMSILLITHDLGVVAEMAHEVAVMYAARMVERTDVVSLFTNPRHPYTHGLLRSRPRTGEKSVETLYAIDGNVPSPRRFPTGCRFHPRCPYQEPICKTDEPNLIETGTGHLSRCHFATTLELPVS